MSASSVSRKFTLIVPTYNRPAQLARLLGYLARAGAKFPVLVLDSSSAEVQQANRSVIEKTACKIRLEIFDSQVSPWEKFRRGAELAETPYCSLCADDDLILTESLDKLIEFLDKHPDHSVAHGWYFTFYENAHVGITASVYRGGSLDDPDPLRRLFALFKNYEAVTYGVYLTEVMRSVLNEILELTSLLGRELLGGALSAVRGKIARLPVFYYGRSHTPSHPYTHWHPLDFMISSPDLFYSDYAAYRRILLACFKSTNYQAYSHAELATLIDLIHFRYLSDYVKPRVMEFLTEQMMARTPTKNIMQGVWVVLARENERSMAGALSGSWWLRRVRDRFFPALKLHHWRRYVSERNETRTVRSVTIGGTPREYLLYNDFLESLKLHPGLQQDVDSIVAAFNLYE